MNNIQIKKTSPLYKFMGMMSKTIIGSLYIEKEYGQYNSFNDICTFVRHFLIAIFIAIPVQLFVLCGASFIAFMWLIYVPIKALILMWSGDATGVPIGTGMVYAYVFIILSYLGLCLLQHYNKKKALTLSTSDPIVKEEGAIKAAFNILSQKHSKFCQRLEVVEDHEKND